MSPLKTAFVLSMLEAILSLSSESKLFNMMVWEKIPISKSSTSIKKEKSNKTFGASFIKILKILARPRF